MTVESCPVCGLAMDLEEDWYLGRVYRCPTCHFRRVEHFDKLHATDFLEKGEKHAA
jgi:DNA-directed RNA polymerase subunit RPC12/RpoP